MKKKLIKYFKSLGIDVYTNTKARGHQGFFLQNRIDISKDIKEERIIPTLLHEFAHYIHAKLEPDMAKTGGSLDILFCLEGKKARGQEDKLNLFGLIHLPLFQPVNTEGSWNFSQTTLEQELLAVTSFVDEHSHNHKLLEHKKQVKEKIKKLETIIRKDYPKFMRSKKFKEFDKYIKKSKARYLLRYDRVKFLSPSFLGLLKKYEIFTIDNLERDFTDMPAAFCAYIRLKSAQKKQARISARINKMNKYYSRPTELFARLVEGVYIDMARTQACAPNATAQFLKLLDSGYYLELKEALSICEGLIKICSSL